MKIAVIGTVMRDEIHTPKGDVRECFGGVLYNVLALATMTRGSDKIFPLCHLSEKHLQMIRKDYFSSLPQIHMDGVRTCLHGTDENILRYKNASDRDETMTINAPPVTDDQLNLAIECDAILINIISGCEIDLNQLARIRRTSRAHIHLDIHNLGKTIDEEGRLQRGELKDWRAWLAQVNTVQANEWEMEMIAGQKPESESQYRESVLTLMALPNVSAAAITIGGHGSVVAHRGESEAALRLLRYPAIPFTDVVDTTGCGDSYSSAFVIEMLRSGNPARAGLMATTLSGINTLASGLDALIAGSHGLEKSAREAFPALYNKIQKGWQGEVVKRETQDV